MLVLIELQFILSSVAFMDIYKAKPTLDIHCHRRYCNPSLQAISNWVDVYWGTNQILMTTQKTICHLQNYIPSRPRWWELEWCRFYTEVHKHTSYGGLGTCSPKIIWNFTPSAIIGPVATVPAIPHTHCLPLSDLTLKVDYEIEEKQAAHC